MRDPVVLYTGEFTPDTKLISKVLNEMGVPATAPNQERKSATVVSEELVGSGGSGLEMEYSMQDSVHWENLQLEEEWELEEWEPKARKVGVVWVEAPKATRRWVSETLARKAR